MGNSATISLTDHKPSLGPGPYTALGALHVLLHVCAKGWTVVWIGQSVTCHSDLEHTLENT